MLCLNEAENVDPRVEGVKFRCGYVKNERWDKRQDFRLSIMQKSENLVGYIFLSPVASVFNDDPFDGNLKLIGLGRRWERGRSFS